MESMPQKSANLIARLARIIGTLLISLVVLFLLVAIALRLPPVQQMAADQAVQYLERKLGTPVSLDRIGLQPLRSLRLRGVYVENPQGDTLIYAGILDAGFSLRNIWSKTIRIRHLDLRRATFQATSENVQFLQDAFASNSPRPRQRSGTGWNILVKPGYLTLRDIRLYFDTGNTALDISLGFLRTDIADFQPAQGHIVLSSLDWRNSAVAILPDTGSPDGASQPAKESRDRPSRAFQVLVQDIDLSDIQYRIEQQRIAMTGHSGRITLPRFTLSLDSIIRMSAPTLNLVGGRFQFDDASPPQRTGFDPAHMDLQEIQLQVKDFTYHDLRMTGQLKNLAARDQSGATLRQASGDFFFQTDSLAVNNLVVGTPQSAIRSPFLAVSLPVEPGEKVGFRVSGASADLNLSELTWFVPATAAYLAGPARTSEQIRLAVDARGPLDDLAINQLLLRGWDSHIRARGNIRGLPNLPKTVFDLDLSETELSGDRLQGLLPDSLLPQGTILPETIHLTARIRGPINDLYTQLNLLASRPELPLSTQVKAQARIRHILADSTLRFSAGLDTLYTGRSDLTAWLPTGTLPDGMRLPEQVWVSGTLTGTVADMRPDLVIRTEQLERAQITGTVYALTDPNELRGNIRLEVNQLSGALLRGFIPPGGLPDSLRLPDIQRMIGLISGRPDAFRANLDAQTTAGPLTGRIDYKAKDWSGALNANRLALNGVLPTSWLSWIPSGKMVPLRLAANAAGRGSFWESESQSDWTVELTAAEDYAWNQGLILRAETTGKTLQAKAQMTEPEIALNGDVRLIDSSGIYRLNGHLDLETLQLQQMGLSQQVFDLSSGLSVGLRGRDLSQLAGTLALRKSKVLYDQIRDEVDSLVVRLNLHPQENRVLLESDVLMASIRGPFDVARINEKVRQHLRRHFLPGRYTPVVRRAGARLEYELRIFETRLLTSGIIPGLRGLQPMRATGSFSESEQTFRTEIRVPYLGYRPFDLDSLQISITSSESDLQYRLHWSNLTSWDQYDISDFTLSGRLVQGEIISRLQQRDQQGRERFAIQASAKPSDSALVIRVQPDLLLNYHPWVLKPDNAIRWLESGVVVEDWQMTFGQQAVRIFDPQPGKEALGVEFTRFHLSNLSELVDFEGDFVGGDLTGTLSLRDWSQSFLLNSDLRADSLTLLNYELGDLDIFLRGGKEIPYAVRVALAGADNQWLAEGDYQPQSEEPLDVSMDITRLDLAPLALFAQGSLSTLAGQASGQLRIGGSPGQPEIRGSLDLQDVTVAPAITGVAYTLPTGRLSIDAQGLAINDWRLYDPREQVLKLDGRLRTRHFRDIAYQLTLSGRDVLVLDTERSDSDLYYGRLIVDADVSLNGPLMQPNIRAQVSNRGETTFTYLYTQQGQNQVDIGKDMVQFVDLNRLPQQDSLELAEAGPTEPDGFSYSLELNTQITNDLTVAVVLDELTGDRFTGKAEGDLTVSMDSDGKLDMTGRLDITQGTYHFTYSDVVKRTFAIGENAFVRFVGEPYDPELNLLTQYRTQAAPLPLLALSGADLTEEEQLALNNKAPFQVNVAVGGTLKNIDIATDIEALNNPPSSITNALAELRSDPSQMNTQAFSLILFNGFMAQTGMNNSSLVDLDLQSGLNEFITQQLNNLANDYISFVELNFGIASDAQSDNLFDNTDFKVSLSKSFLDDRLEISVDGRATTREDAGPSTQAFLDNLSVTYLLTRDGVLKVRIFNERDIDDFAGGNTMRMGGALIFSKDFDRIRFFARPESGASNQTPKDE